MCSVLVASISVWMFSPNKNVICFGCIYFFLDCLVQTKLCSVLVAFISFWTAQSKQKCALFSLNQFLSGLLSPSKKCALFRLRLFLSELLSPNKIVLCFGCIYFFLDFLVQAKMCFVLVASSSFWTGQSKQNCALFWLHLFLSGLCSPNKNVLCFGGIYFFLDC